MKTTNFVGFFQSTEKLQKALNSLEIAGFKPSEIIAQTDTNDHLMVCVQLADQYDHRMAFNIFKFYGVNHTDEFEGKIDNSDDLRRIISIHSKQQIFSPKTNRHHNHYHEGMNSEVKFT